MKKQGSQDDFFQQSGTQGKQKSDMSYQSQPDSQQFMQQRGVQSQQHQHMQQQMKQSKPGMMSQQPNMQFNQMQGQRSHQGFDSQPMYHQQTQQMQQQQQQQQNQNMLVGAMDIRGLTQRISSKEVLDQNVEKILSQISEDFVKNVAEFACKLAKHRGSDTLEKEDIKFAIEKLYNIPTPIKPSSDRQLTQIQAASSSSLGQASTSNYKQNLALVKKANDQNQGS